MSLTRDKILRNPRFAFGVKRYHTWPTIQQQTNADHTANSLMIYLQLFKVIPPEVTEFILWHDAGELVVGDPPFPVKARNPLLKAEHDRIEAEAVREMGGRTVMLAEPAKTRTKLVDLLEMLAFGLVEVGLGNRYAQPIIDDILIAVGALQEKLSEEDCRLVRAYVTAMTSNLVVDDARH